MLETLHALIPAAQGGDRAALEDVLRGSAGVAHAIARARLGDGAEAEAVAAEVLRRVARGLGGLREPRAYPRWLHRITVRVAAGRRAASEAPLDERLGLATGAPGPVETLLAVERAQRIRAAVAGLSPALRECVLLHFVEGLTYREVGALAGVGLGTVARRMRRGLAAIRAELETEGED